MAWIESHQSLRDHWKTKKLARLLGIHKMQAVGHVHGLWWWSLDCSRSGSLGHLDAIDIASGCDWDGDELEFVEALVQCQFLDRTDDDLRIHDWDQYAGRLMRQREADAERKRSARRTPDVPVASAGHPTDAPQVGVVTQPTQPTKPRKRGEYTPEFESWWATYPKKGDTKSTAFEVWDRLPDDHRALAESELPKWLPYYASIENHLIPDARTWLNQRRWENEPPPPESPRNNLTAFPPRPVYAVDTQAY